MLIRADLDYSISCQKSWQQLSWRQIKRNCAVPNDCIPNEAQTVTPAVQPPKSKALTFCSHPLRFSSSLHVSPSKGHKNENTTKKLSKKWRKTCRSIWHDVSQTFSCLHEIHPNDLCNYTYVKSSDLIKPPEEFFHRHLQQIPPSLRLAVEKVQDIEMFTSAKAVECCVPSRRPLTTEAAAEVVAAEDVHSIGHVAPDRCVAIHCGRRFRSGDSWLQRLAWRKVCQNLIMMRILQISTSKY